MCRSIHRKRAFFLSFMNSIDLVAILPTYVILAVPSLSKLSIAKLFRIMRVLRIFKLSRHSNGLQVLAKTGMACKHELGLLLFCLLVFSLLFSAVLFFAEENMVNTGFESIPHTMWWAVVTITTVGYGDLAPETTLGRSVLARCGDQRERCGRGAKDSCADIRKLILRFMSQDHGLCVRGDGRGYGRAAHLSHILDFQRKVPRTQSGHSSQSQTRRAEAGADIQIARYVLLDTRPHMGIQKGAVECIWVQCGWGGSTGRALSAGLGRKEVDVCTPMSRCASSARR